MGTYYNPDKVESLGNRVHGYQSVAGGDSLIAVLDNGVYRIAADVTVKDEFNDFNRSYGQGHWLSLKTYVISKNNLLQCADEGRKKSTYNSR